MGTAAVTPLCYLFPWVPPALTGTTIPSGWGVKLGSALLPKLNLSTNFHLQTEAPLLIRPYLADMTLSEVHVVMTGGYATIAGSLLGAYISFGVGGAVPLLSHAKALKPGIVGALHAF